MEMLNDSQNEMEFKDDSRFYISSISTRSIDTSSTCERKQQIESKIQTYTRIHQDTKRELVQNSSIHNDNEYPEYKSLKNSIRLKPAYLLEPDHHNEQTTAEHKNTTPNPVDPHLIPGKQPNTSRGRKINRPVRFRE
ncbi:hypothetical protein NPIL_394401 [Nephila pilipes]|uniref:Uncharacterized protein n=1 Tax=Nephila pilipes TaxID=299642 RepID=A0A8X6IVZ0_NEPPI|nr:hypothetical protein NPIL_394401 [Nephila pilipes]